MTEKSLKEKTVKGLFWGGVNNGLQQVLNLLFGIFLARLLAPADYGMVGMLTIFSAIAATLQEGGFISALTNKRNASHKDFNSVFWFNTICSLFIYIILFFSAPLIAGFYGEPELIPLSRVSFLGFFIASLNIAPRAYLFKTMRVKDATFITVTSLFVSGMVGVILAFNGFAYWGIAYQSITYVASMTILTYYYAKWKPSFSFDFHPIKGMIGYSSKIIITNVFVILNNNLFSVLLGKFYTANDVGNFSQANKWNNMGSNMISGMINSIAQPVLSQVTDDKPRRLAIFRKMLRFTALLSFPSMFCLSLVSQEFITIAITDKWTDSSHLLKYLCVWGAFIPFTTLFSNLILSLGHSNIFMWNNLCLGSTQLVIACIIYPLGIDAMIKTFVAINILWLLVWYLSAGRKIGLGFTDMIKDVLPYFITSVASVLIACYATSCMDNIYISFILKIMITSVAYCFVLWRLKSVIFMECIAFVRRKMF